jgi:hypothetical protein
MSSEKPDNSRLERSAGCGFLRRKTMHGPARLRQAADRLHPADGRKCVAMQLKCANRLSVLWCNDTSRALAKLLGSMPQT